VDGRLEARPRVLSTGGRSGERNEGFRTESETGESEKTHRKAIARDVVAFRVCLKRWLGPLRGRWWRRRLFRAGRPGQEQLPDDEQADRKTDREQEQDALGRQLRGHLPCWRQVVVCGDDLPTPVSPYPGIREAVSAVEPSVGPVTGDDQPSRDDRRRAEAMDLHILVVRRLDRVRSRNDIAQHGVAIDRPIVFGLNKSVRQQPPKQDAVTAGRPGSLIVLAPTRRLGTSARCPPRVPLVPGQTPATTQPERYCS